MKTTSSEHFRPVGEEIAAEQWSREIFWEDFFFFQEEKCMQLLQAEHVWIFAKMLSNAPEGVA